MNAWMGFVGATANRQHYFDFGKRTSQTSFQTAGVSVDALTSLFQSCGVGGFQWTMERRGTDRRLVLFPLTGAQQQHQIKRKEYGLGVGCHSGIFQICSL